jgi:hypothetical protein
VRDAEGTLEEALESVRAQTHADFTCHVLDDGSRDASASIAERFAARDARFVVHRGPPRGIAGALNAGIALSGAKILVRADADDVNEPRRFSALARVFEENPEIDVAASRISFFGGDLSDDLLAYESWINSPATHEEIVRELFVESPLPHPAVALRAEAVRRVGGYRDGPFPEDYDLWLRGWRAGWRFAKVGDVLVRVRDHPARLTRVDPRYRPAAFLACKVEHLVAARRLQGEQIIVWGAGRDGVRVARAFKRRGVEIRFFVDIAPTKIGRRLAGAPILAPEALDEKPGTLVIAAVGVKGARAKIRSHLAARGYGEPDELVCFG